MTARCFEQQIPRRLQAKHGVSSRAVTILLALLADAGPSSTDEVEPFWVRQFIVFALYSAIQSVDFGLSGGPRRRFAATMDKVFAASPAIVTALIQMSG